MYPTKIALKRNYIRNERRWGGEKQDIEGKHRFKERDGKKLMREGNGVISTARVSVV